MKRLDSASFDLASAILTQANEMTLATVRADGSPHATTVSFASDGLTLYAAIALDSHKAHDIRHDARVSLTVNAPFRSWSEIQGVSIDGIASFVDQRALQARVSELILRKLPAYASIISDAEALPWPGMLFMQIDASAMTLLDYTRRFGYSEQFDLR